MDKIEASAHRIEVQLRRIPTCSHYLAVLFVAWFVSVAGVLAALYLL